MQQKVDLQKSNKPQNGTKEGSPGEGKRDLAGTAVDLLPLEKNNPDHVGMMYKVRTHSEVDKYLSGNPPNSFLDHVKYLHGVKENKRFYLISYATQLCGYCQATWGDDHVELGWALHPDYWGKGLGDSAIGSLLALVKPEALKKSILLFVRKDNSKAIHLYHKHGFKITREDVEKNEYVMEYFS